MIGLKPFQQEAVEHGVNIFNDLFSDLIHLNNLDQREQLIKHKGCLLLEAPTGAGKTLIAGHIADRLCINNKIVWFWFSPFANLLDQTELVIQSQFNRLKIRNIHQDRDINQINRGNIFVTTWATVAASNSKSRRVRMNRENVSSIDKVIQALKAMGYLIGVVIDEAHHGFVKATEAVNFFKNVLQPDATILVTATPRDKDVQQFQKVTDIAHISKNIISRQDCVNAGLVKKGIKLTTFFAGNRSDEELIDFEKTALRHAMIVNDNIAKSLLNIGISLTPLLLVQVGSDPDSVERTKQHLRSLGFAEQAIAVHTNDEPDPDLVALANDETKQVLIFKMAVAMGFDAPRAFTLVSMRASRDEAFGLQLIGRILRVHRSLQGVELPDFLQYGYVFLADKSTQTGLLSAAQRINELRTELAQINTEIGVYMINESQNVVQVYPGGQVTLPIDQLYTLNTYGHSVSIPNIETNKLEKDIHKNEQVVINTELKPHQDNNYSISNDQLDNLISIPQDDFNILDLLGISDEGNLHKNNKTKPANQEKLGNVNQRAFRLREDITFPGVFYKEMLNMNDGIELLDSIVRNFPIDEKLVVQSQRSGVQIIRREIDLFKQEDNIDVSPETAEFSSKTIALQAQQVLFEDEFITMRDLYPRLKERLILEYKRHGLYNFSPEQIEHGLNLILTLNKDLLKKAKRQSLRKFVQSVEGSNIPGMIGVTNPEGALKNLYKVFPDGLNSEERMFAENLDADYQGIIKWWIRNEPRKDWSASVALENGNYYPDFIVGVNNRNTKDNIILIEVKGSHILGSQDSLTKSVAEHCSYGKVMMVTFHQGQWYIVENQNDKNILGRLFMLEDLKIY
ncbi:DEAD/DEAH box helicase family protein [Gottfriedia acidiceleris]|uniref:DEAD/DEAH box helicase n=1 Tax=Gottfriedia acidiceleris TaxID=371036 RepID=UPI002FFE9E30